MKGNLEIEKHAILHRNFYGSDAFRISHISLRGGD